MRTQRLIRSVMVTLLFMLTGAAFSMGLWTLVSGEWQSSLTWNTIALAASAHIRLTMLSRPPSPPTPPPYIIPDDDTAALVERIRSAQQR